MTKIYFMTKISSYLFHETVMNNDYLKIPHNLKTTKYMSEVQLYDDGSLWFGPPPEVKYHSSARDFVHPFIFMLLLVPSFKKDVYQLYIKTK